MPSDILIPEYEKLFQLLATLECATTPQIHQLFYSKLAPKKNWSPAHKGLIPVRSIGSMRNTRGRLTNLEHHAFLARLFFVQKRTTRSWHLTDRGLKVFPSVQATTPLRVTNPSPHDALRGSQRADLWIATTSRRGVFCDQSDTARTNLSQVTGNEIPRLVPLPYDIVHGRSQDGQALAYILLVDDTREHPLRLVASLPIHTASRPKVKIVFRPSRDGSVWDPSNSRWLPGRRMAEIVTLIHQSPQGELWWPENLSSVGVAKTAPETTLVDQEDTVREIV